MKAPQIIVIALMVMRVTVEMMQNGQTIPQKHSIVTELIGKAILCALLWWGGFWD